MTSAESMDELLVNMKTCKSEMEKKDPRVTMGNAKIVVSGIDLDMLKIIWKESLWRLSDMSR